MQIETERSRLRPSLLADLEPLRAAVNDPRFPASLPLRRKLDAGELETWLQGMCTGMESGRSWIWSADLRSGAVCIGQVSLVPVPEPRQWSLAFWLTPEHWGEGLALEIVSGTVRFAFQDLGLERISACVATWNHASRALLMKLGFRPESAESAEAPVAHAKETQRWLTLVREQWHSIGAV